MLPPEFWKNVEKTETCWLWTRGSGRYGSWRGRGVHIWAWEDVHGPMPPGKVVDHKCHTKRCVREEHLRDATRLQNAQNRQSANRTSSTGARNVYPDGPGKYIVCVQVRGKRRQYGRFDTIEAAAVRAEEVRAKLFS